MGTFDYDGQYYRVRDCSIWPRPLQVPPKIWMACGSTETLEFALSRGAYVVTGIVDNGHAGSLYQRSRDITTAEGFDLPDDWDDWFGGISLIYVDESDSKARSAVREHLKEYQQALSIFDTPIVTLVPGYRSAAGLQTFLEQYRAGQTRDISEYSLEEGIEKGIVLVGSPDSVVEQLKRKKEESGINVVMSFMRFGAMPKQKAFSSIELFAEEVLPKVRDF